MAKLTSHTIKLAPIKSDPLAPFAKSNKLKLTDTDDDGTIILGRCGHIYEYSDTRLGLLYTSAASGWNARRDAAVEAGMTLLQNGDLEGTLSFDPANPKQAKLAIKISSPIRRKLAA
jgi:hypothetical protein